MEELLNILPPSISKTYIHDRTTKTYELTIQKFKDRWTCSYRNDKDCPDKLYKSLNYIQQNCIFFTSSPDLNDCLETMKQVLIKFKYIEL